MNRAEIEIKLNRDRAWLLETVAAMRADEIERGVTPSEHDSSLIWNIKDHLAHLAGIERSFNAMVRRHVDGDANPVGLANNSDGTPRSMLDIMAMVHRMNEEFVAEHRGRPLLDIVAAGQVARAETLALLASLTDDQLAEKLPGAPWADGTVGGVLAVNADHGRQHWKWVKQAIANAGQASPSF
jgi:DinB superfamily